jgi:hypothetical protein
MRHRKPEGTCRHPTGTIPAWAAWSAAEEKNMDKTTPAASAGSGKQIPPKRHDAGSGANETTDGLDATNEALRHAAEDTPSGATPDDVETVPVFDRADLAPKI